MTIQLVFHNHSPIKLNTQSTFKYLEIKSASEVINPADLKDGFVFSNHPVSYSLPSKRESYGIVITGNYPVWLYSSIIACLVKDIEYTWVGWLGILDQEMGVVIVHQEFITDTLNVGDIIPFA